MKRICCILLFAVISVVSAPAIADLAPSEGTFTGYFYVDRWGQGVFNNFYVNPKLTPKLKQEGWCPIRITATQIYQPMNPGGAMIQQIGAMDLLKDPTLELMLTVDKQSIAHGGRTTLIVIVRNRSKEPIELYRRNLLLSVTVHKRGTLPGKKVERDEIFDCFNNPFHDFQSDLRYLRATSYLKLFTDKGDISMIRGDPRLFIRKDGTRKRAGIYDEGKRTVPSEGSVSFSYELGSGWLVNEYELQVRYHPRRKALFERILSEPVSFDVKSESKESD